MTQPIKKPSTGVTNDNERSIDAPEDNPLVGKFNPNVYDWQNHLKVAIAEMRLKVVDIEMDWRYYDGDHPRVWLTDSLAKMFDNHLSENMSENWCDIATDAPIKRLNITGWTNPDDNTIHTQAADNIFKDNDMELEQKELYRQARAVGESYAFVWKDDDKEFGIDISINDARNVWWPRNAKRNDPDRVIKMWVDPDTSLWRATIYYRYVVVRLVGPKEDSCESIPEVKSFDIDPDDPGGIHGFEKVPVIRFAIQKRRKGVIRQIRHIQDKINKLVANKLVAAEFNAFGKTFIMTTQVIDDDTLKFKPDKAIILDPGGDATSGVAPTSIYESNPLELLNYDQSIGTEIDKLFTIAGLPGHMQVKSTREIPSGAAYEADEGPFTEMIGDLQDTFGASWTDLMQLAGVECKPQWRNPHIHSDADESVTVGAFVQQAKMPLSLALKYYAGWDDDQLKELMNAPLSPAEAQQMAMATALMNGGGQDGTTDSTGQPQSGNNNSGASGQSANAGNAGKPKPPALA